jgi:transmembrane sensor
MINKTTGEDVDHQAAAWAVKLDAHSMTAEDETMLDAWLAEDLRHRGAFAKARAILVPGEENALRPAETVKAGRSRRYWLYGAVAATAILTVGAGGMLWRFLSRESYSTHVGETRVIPLSDGSVVTLNTNSVISVDYTRERREVRLIQGEALFDVAKNKHRPFIVMAGLTQVRAVGTSFVVKILPDQPVQVLVREGVVEVKRPDVPVAAPVRVTADTRAVAPVDAPIEIQAVPDGEVKRALAWRVGRIAFYGESLKDAAAEFARYSDIRITIDDPEVASRTVTGLFVSNDPVGFAKGVAFSLNLHAEVGDQEIRLSR